LEASVYDGNFSCAAWNADCNSVTTGQDNGFLRVWNCNTGECLIEHQVKTLDEPALILAVDASHDNHYAIITYRRKRAGYTTPFYELGLGIVDMLTGELIKADNVVDERIYGRCMQAFTSGWQHVNTSEISLIQMMALSAVKLAVERQRMVSVTIEHPYVKAVGELPELLGLAAKKRMMIQVRPV